MLLPAGEAYKGARYSLYSLLRAEIGQELARLDGGGVPLTSVDRALLLLWETLNPKP